MTLPTLVMLPGTLCDARIFRRQKRALRGVAHVRALDYRGLDRLDTWAPAARRQLARIAACRPFPSAGGGRPAQPCADPLDAQLNPTPSCPVPATLEKPC